MERPASYKLAFVDSSLQSNYATCCCIFCSLFWFVINILNWIKLNWIELNWQGGHSKFRTFMRYRSTGGDHVDADVGLHLQWGHTDGGRLPSTGGGGCGRRRPQLSPRTGNDVAGYPRGAQCLQRTDCMSAGTVSHDGRV